MQLAIKPKLPHRNLRKFSQKTFRPGPGPNPFKKARYKIKLFQRHEAA